MSDDEYCIACFAIASSCLTTRTCALTFTVVVITASSPSSLAARQHEAELPLVKHVADMLPWLRIVQHAFGDGPGTTRLKRAETKSGSAEPGELVTMAHAVEAYALAASGEGGIQARGERVLPRGGETRTAPALLVAGDGARMCRAAAAAA